jgi:membrane associated rhomboid family serine protease
MGQPFRNRSFGSPQMTHVTPAVKWLLIVNTGVFLLQFLARIGGWDAVFDPFCLIPDWVLRKLAFWQLGTYLFLHSPAGFSHILMNMLSLWMFGSPLESVWGTRRFLRFYFACGIGAGAIAVAANAAFGLWFTRTMGASGAIYGLILAFGVLFPTSIIYFFGLFPIQARYFVWIMGAIVFLSTIGDSGGTVSHVAHLGGMAIGFVMLRRGMQETRRRVGPGLVARCQAWYKEWKLARAKKKFQVYLKKQNSKRSDWVN